jgi:hypothetical protein
MKFARLTKPASVLLALAFFAAVGVGMIKPAPAAPTKSPTHISAIRIAGGQETHGGHGRRHGGRA